MYDQYILAGTAVACLLVGFWVGDRKFSGVVKDIQGDVKHIQLLIGSIHGAFTQTAAPAPATTTVVVPAPVATVTN
jgi:hypothetical protein